FVGVCGYLFWCSKCSDELSGRTITPSLRLAIFSKIFLNAGKHVHEMPVGCLPLDNRRVSDNRDCDRKTVPSFVPTTKPYRVRLNVTESLEARVQHDFRATS